MNAGRYGFSPGIQAVQKILIATQTPIGLTFATFPVIPQDRNARLVLEFMVRSTQAANAVNGLLEFNGDTTDANYRYGEIHRNGSGLGSASAAVRQFAPSAISGASAPASGYTVGTIKISEYANPGIHKIAIAEFVNPYDATTVFFSHNLVGYRWSNSAPITQIDFRLSAGNFDVSSVLRLYLEV